MNNIIPLQDITQSPQQLHIASLIAHVRPEYLVPLRAWLLEQTHPEIHVEVHAESSLGKWVLVTESPYEKAIVNFLDDLRAQPGVLNAALVYHEYLSAQDLLDDAINEQQILNETTAPDHATINNEELYGKEWREKELREEQHL